jgi:TonB family protein
LNQTPRPLPKPRRKISGYAFLVCLILAAQNLPLSAAPPAQKGIETLDTELATKLLIHVVKPRYPAIAKVNFVQGNVRLEIRVNSAGQVADIHVLDGEPLLAVAAMEAVRKWLYKPYVSPQGATAFTTEVVVKFALHPHSLWGKFPTDSDSYMEKQVRPPEVISRPQHDPSASTLKLKVLVGSKGEVLDAVSEGPEVADSDRARQNLQAWKFQPARWGALSVPWYIIVNVPLDQPITDQVANSAKH